MKRNLKPRIFFFLMIFLGLIAPRETRAQADSQQEIGRLEARVANLEHYVDSLTQNINQQFQFINNKTVKIDLFSKSFQKVETNSGIFLVSIESVKEEGNGYKFGIKIGNISNADYNGFRLRLRWGKDWDPKLFDSIAAWRNSLTGIEYKFTGRLASGNWTNALLTVTPAKWEQLRYAELEMDVEAVELISK